MSKIVFFSIPAYGHTNPTIEVVRQLCEKGNEVWYYSYSVFKEKIEDTGAKYIESDKYLPEFRPEDKKKIDKKDFAALIEMVVDTTLVMDEPVCQQLSNLKPDCIVSDSICFWGKLFARKLKISFISSTTTFAFNDHTAKLIKPGFIEALRTFFGWPRINRKMKQLRENGYEVDSFVSLIGNDNKTNTIVYTSKEFQPLADTFSDKFVFVGPSVKEIKNIHIDKKQPLIYISLGSVVTRNKGFYRNCIKAFGNKPFDVIMSVGKDTTLESLGKIPSNMEVKNWVNQIEVLQRADVFISHCGMNSVNESLYFGVPIVTFPQHSEQGLVAKRVVDLGAGIPLRKNNSELIYEAVQEILTNESYKEKARKIGEGFKKSGGAKKAASFILDVIEKGTSD
ncbi:MAG: glycosyltransferase [Atribacterota bacterium]|nr:glycosyltransferase [Atribacterota bacterium]